MSDQEVVYIDHMGDDMSVVNAARVSFANSDDESRTQEDNEKLINYLARHNHWTPFAHTSITLRMKAPVPIRTQCFKHKQGAIAFISMRKQSNVDFVRSKQDSICRKVVWLIGIGQALLQPSQDSPNNVWTAMHK